MYADRPSSSFPSLFTGLCFESDLCFVGMFKTTEKLLLTASTTPLLELTPLFALIIEK